MVGVSVALAAARRGADVVLLEAEPELGLAASGTNSGILHTGFDSHPGELETRLILRSAELRDAVLSALDIPVLRVGALLHPRDRDRARGRRTARRQRPRERRRGRVAPDGSLFVPGESVTDPVAYTRRSPPPRSVRARAWCAAPASTASRTTARRSS